MGNARIVSNKIWRTVVVAGAMLGTPACGGGKKPTPVAPGPTVEEQKAADEQKAAANDAAAKAEAESTAAAKSAEDARLLAEKEAADAAAAKEAADKGAAEEAAKKRPRGGGQKPVGRGFVLA